MGYTLRNEPKTSAEYFTLISVFDSMPSDWKMILKEQPIQRTDDNESRKINFLTASRQLYWDLMCRKL